MAPRPASFDNPKQKGKTSLSGHGRQETHCPSWYPPGQGTKSGSLGSASFLGIACQQELGCSFPANWAGKMSTGFTISPRRERNPFTPSSYLIWLPADLFYRTVYSGNRDFLEVLFSPDVLTVFGNPALV